MMNDFKCDKCNKDISIEEVGFLGPVDGNEDCHPFLEMQTLCKQCYKK